MKWFIISTWLSLRLSLVFLILTLSWSIKWILFLVDAAWQDKLEDFASNTFSAQYTFSEKQTIFASATTLTYTETDTATLVTTPVGASAATARTTTGTFTFTDTYTSGQPFYSTATAYYSQITFAPSLATVVVQDCIGKCTGLPATTRTITSSTPTAAPLSPSTVARNEDLHKRAVAAFVFTVLLALSTLVHSITSLVFNIRFFRMLDFPYFSGRPARFVNNDAASATSRERPENTTDEHVISSIRLMIAVYCGFTVLDFIFGISSIILLSIHHNTSTSFLSIGIAFWAVAIATCLLSMATLYDAIRLSRQTSDTIGAASRRRWWQRRPRQQHQSTEDANGGETRVEKRAIHDNDVISPVL